MNLITLKSEVDGISINLEHVAAMQRQGTTITFTLASGAIIKWGNYNSEAECLSTFDKLVEFLKDT